MVQNVFDVISRVIDVGTMSFQRVISPVILPTPQGCYNVGLLHLVAGVTFRGHSIHSPCYIWPWGRGERGGGGGASVGVAARGGERGEGGVVFSLLRFVSLSVCIW